MTNLIYKFIKLFSYSLGVNKAVLNVKFYILQLIMLTFKVPTYLIYLLMIYWKYENVEYLKTLTETFRFNYSFNLKRKWELI